MIVELAKFLDKMSGGVDSNYYAVPCPGRPGYVIVRLKPGKRSLNWKMKEGQAKGVRRQNDVVAQAKAEYNDPVKKEAWRTEYLRWKREEQKRGREGVKLNGKIVRHLWDYVRIRISERMRNTPTT